MNVKKLLTLLVVVSFFSFSPACGEVHDDTLNEEHEVELTQEDYEALALEEFEVDLDALIALDEEIKRHDAKADVHASGMVAIAARNLGNVQNGVRTVEIARGIFAVARWALIGVQVAALANPVAIGGILIAGAVGAAIWYANKKAQEARSGSNGQTKWRTWNGVTKRQRCSDHNYNLLRDRYKNVCGLWSRCPANMSCSVASEHLMRAQQCVAARKRFNQACFNNVGDPGHDETLRNAERNVQNCFNRVRNTCRAW